MLTRKELNEIAKEIVKENMDALKNHLDKERKNAFDFSEKSMQSWKAGFIQITEEYLKRHGIDLSTFEKEDLYLLVAMQSMIATGGDN
ncbi:hypothetical protein J7K43_02305 [Candidatus Calescamantes bacterium]|nr:hypothetical protein [Candidatus Calescamantes bacterium]